MGRFAERLQNTYLPPSSTTPVKLLKDPTTGCMLAYGTSVPSGAAGYAIGCLFVHTDATSGTELYKNTGTASSCTFSALHPAAATIANGSVVTDAGAGSNSLAVTTQTQACAFTIPDVNAASINFVFDAATQTLTNKTLTTPTLNGPTVNLATAGSKYAVLSIGSTHSTANRNLVLKLASDAAHDVTFPAGLTTSKLVGHNGTEAQGDIIYRGASAWTLLPAGTSGQALLTNGAAANPSWGMPSITNATQIANGATLNDAGGNDAVLAFTTQTVGAPTLTIPDFASVNDTFTFNTLAATLANKTLTTPTINGGTLNVASGGAYYMRILCGTALGAANRTLTITIPDSATALTLTHDLIRVGAHSLTLTTTNTTDVTLPTTGTLATVNGALGTATATTINKVALTAPASGSTLTIADGKTLTCNASLTLAGTDAKTLTLNETMTLTAGAASKTFTLPADNDTIVGRASTDTLTNKSFDCDGSGNALTNVNANELDPITPAASATYGIPFVINMAVTNLDNAGTDFYTDNAPFKFRVLDAWAINTSANGGDWQINKGKVGALGNAIVSAVTLGAVDKALGRAAAIDDAEHEIAANGSLVAVGDAGATLDAIIYVLCMRVD